MISIAPGVSERLATTDPDFDFNALRMVAEGAFSMHGGMIGVVFILVYLITVGNKLVAMEIDRGSLSFILNTPTTRKQIILTKAIFYYVSIIALILTIGIVSTIAGAVINIPFDLGRLWIMLLGLLMFTTAISGICFFASCWFNKSSLSLLVGAGVPLLFFLFSSLSAMPDLDWMRFLSINTLFDAIGVVNGESFIFQYIALFAIGAIMYTIGIIKFLKKDLPL